jgi:hypothetical protein
MDFPTGNLGLISTYKWTGLKLVMDFPTGNLGLISTYKWRGLKLVMDFPTGNLGLISTYKWTGLKLVMDFPTGNLGLISTYKWTGLKLVMDFPTGSRPHHLRLPAPVSWQIRLCTKAHTVWGSHKICTEAPMIIPKGVDTRNYMLGTLFTLGKALTRDTRTKINSCYTASKV